MIDTQLFGAHLRDLGYSMFSGVPCSHLKSLINVAINGEGYISASNEGDAVAVCAGAALGGRKAAFLCQNSGLTNATSPITSLLHTFRIPLLGFVSLRGEPGIQDEPQHELMGEITTGMLDLMRIPWAFLSANQGEARAQLDEADKLITSGTSYFFVVRHETLGPVKLEQRPLRERVLGTIYRASAPDTYPSRAEALAEITHCRAVDAAVLATTGFTGRELYSLADDSNNLYMVGSMGCVTSIGLGLSRALPERKIICIDGDGAALMRLGALPMLAHYAEGNLLHILLDNHAHDSTGGQDTVSRVVDFPALAHASGYPISRWCADLQELREGILEWQRSPQLSFLYLRVAKGQMPNLGRPKVKPYEVKVRFMDFVNSR